MDTYTTNFHESSHNSYDIVKYLKLYFNISNYDDDHLFTTDEIFDILSHKIDNAPFGKFLAEYICKRSGNSISAENIDAQRAFLISTFKQKELIGKPSLFNTDKTAITGELLNKQSRNWLGNVCPSRESIFLLAFALDMDCDDLTAFLTKGIHDKNINYKSPAEICTYYCLKNGLDYDCALRFICKAKTLSANIVKRSPANILTESYRKLFDTITDADKLTEHCAQLISENNDPSHSICAKECYKRLLSYISQSAVLDKRISVEAETGIKISSSDMIAFGTIERYIYYYIPVKTISGHYRTDSLAAYENGNILGKQNNYMKDQKWFFSTLLRRSDLKKMYDGQKKISRDTIITLAFFAACEESPYSDTYEYIADINDYLNFCRYEQMNFSYPYDLFIFMCLQTDDPLSSFRSIWSRSWIKSD